MGTVSPNYGTRTAYPSVSNLASLASTSAVAVGNVTNSTAPAGLSATADGFKVDAKVVLAASGVSATGTLSFYVIESTDGGTTYSDGISPSSGSNQAASIKNARLAFVAVANAVSQTVAVTFDLPGINPPKDHSILVLNGSGAALAASGHALDYTAIGYGD